MNDQAAYLGYWNAGDDAPLKENVANIIYVWLH